MGQLALPLPTGGLRMRAYLGWLQGLCSMKPMPHFNFKGFRVVDAVSCCPEYVQYPFWYKYFMARTWDFSLFGWICVIQQIHSMWKANCQKSVNSNCDLISKENQCVCGLAWMPLWMCDIFDLDTDLEEESTLKSMIPGLVVFILGNSLNSETYSECEFYGTITMERNRK